MRALVLKEFGTLVVEDRPDPTPGPDEAVLDVVATGICGTDLHGFTGENGRRVPGQIMGHETVARIRSLGGDADGLSVGQVVTFNPMVLPTDQLDAFAGREQHCPDKYVIGVRHDYTASFAQQVVVPIRNLVTLPEGAPIEHGALVEPLAVGVHAVRRVVGAGTRTALVIGGGPIGQSVVLALGMEGVETIVVSEVDAGRRVLLEGLGCHVVDPSAGPVDEAVRAAIGDLVDVAIDAVGIAPTVEAALQATKLGGAVCLVGMGRPWLEVDAFAISTAERALVGSFAYAAQDFVDAAAWIADNPERAAALISEQVPMDDAPATFIRLAGGDMPAGKVLVRLDR